MERIDGLIEEFLKLPKDSTAIAEMLYLRENIAGELYFISTKLGQARKQMMLSKSLYEAKKVQKRVEYLDRGVGYADAISRANSTVEFARMNSDDGNYHLIKFNYESTREVLNALSQKISWLKKEQEYTRAIS